MEENFYDVLGISKTATKEEIKKAYKKQALQYHPDRMVGKSEEEQKEAEEKFKKISEAYSVLSDDEKRKQYDMFGSVGGGSGFDEDMFGDFFNPFARYRNRRSRQERGQDISIQVVVSVEDIYNNIEKTIRYKRKEVCHHCNGKGHDEHGHVEKCKNCNGTGMETKSSRKGFTIFQETTICHECGGKGTYVVNPCSHCGGQGLVDAEKEVSFKVKDAVYRVDRTPFFIYGAGSEHTSHTAENGNLYINTALEEKDGYSTENGMDVEKNIKVNIFTAIIGGTYILEYLDGKKYKITIPEKSKDGKKIVLKGKGIETPFGIGNLILKITHEMPNKISKKIKKAIEEEYGKDKDSI